ncbi:hypothetical protein DYB25_007348 [Aphanomyces astaci]|uniref:Uncharacterized protein n=1 Tax=Aphanomyces astaci TaxID=112090 RepID=A0A397A0S2_APHAT|nr:hypothetical protein DYB25_007348 [Aphanomyces astaci]
MKYVRRDEHILTSMHMITFMKTYHAAWLDDYKVGKRDSYKSLLKLCQDFARRHNFSQRVPCYTKMPSVDMEALRNDSAGQCWNKYHAYESCDILNVDETDVNYDIQSRVKQRGVDTTGGEEGDSVTGRQGPFATYWLRKTGCLLATWVAHPT